MTSYIREMGPKLVANGYPVVELAPGMKRPLRKDWSSRPLSAQACRQREASEGVGILCGYGDKPICAVDVDFYGTQAEADALFEAMCKAVPGCGLAVYRVGRAPKFALLFQAEGVWAKAVTKAYFKDGDPDTKSRVEILGKGQQLALYHIHPDTNEPYCYPMSMLTGEPADVPVRELPLLTYKDVQALCELFERFMDESGWALDAKSEARMAVSYEDALARELEPKRPVGLSLEEIKEVFEANEYDWEDYEQWLHGGMRIHHETGGSPEGLTLWDELSQTAKNYGGVDLLAYKWSTFKDHGGNSLSMWSLAKKAGFVSARASALTEDGLACRLVRYSKGAVRYETNKGCWYYFKNDTGLWEKEKAQACLSGDIVERIVFKALATEIQEARNNGDDELADEIQKFQLRCANNRSSIVKKTRENVSNIEEVCISERDFDKKDGYIAVKNGLVNLATRDLIPNKPEYLMVRHCEVEYDPTAECPTWRRCVSEWFENEEVARYIQKVLGKMLTGTPEEEAFYLLVGDGANGKSSFLDALRRVMGGYAKTVADNVIMGSRENAPGGARADLAALGGVRLAYCSETGDGDTLRAAVLKRMTGRDEMSARWLFSNDDVTYVPQFTLFVATNFPPRLRGGDNAVRRRIRMIRFPRDYENGPDACRRIPGLAKKLENEAQGILNWMLEGYDMAMREGVKIPTAVLQESNEYADSQDLVSQWFMSECELAEGERETVATMFRRYREWVEAQNDREGLMAQRGFTERLKKHIERKGLHIRLKKSNGKNYFVGVALRYDEPTSDAPDDFEDIP